MASVTFAAFTHEAFLNMLGEQILAKDDWQQLNRVSWKKKHEALFSELQIVTNFSAEPESILVQIFQFRNRIAHGCEETTSFQETLVEELSPLTLQEATLAPWEQLCTAEFATRALEAVRLVGVQIRIANGEPQSGLNPFGSYLGGVYSAISGNA